jgi:hypothetical protein
MLVESGFIDKLYAGVTERILSVSSDIKLTIDNIHDIKKCTRSLHHGHWF